MSFDYEIPYFWVHVGPPDMPEPGFYEDPMSMPVDGAVPVLEKMWRNVGYNMSGECAHILRALKPANVLLCLDTFRENAGIKPGREFALLIRGHGNGSEQKPSGGDENVQQLYIPRAKCVWVERPSPDEWQEDDTDPYNAILNFEADFKSIRYLDSETEADAWDKQIEEDALAGKLDALAEHAMANFEAGRYTEL